MKIKDIFDPNRTDVSDIIAKVGVVVRRPPLMVSLYPIKTPRKHIGARGETNRIGGSSDQSFDQSLLFRPLEPDRDRVLLPDVVLRDDPALDRRPPMPPAEPPERRLDPPALSRLLLRDDPFVFDLLDCAIE